LKPERAGNGTEERKRGGPFMDRASASTVARLSTYFRLLVEFERENAETIP